MNERERFLRTMRCEEVDRPPFILQAPWIDTLERWHREGLPEDKSPAEYLGLPEFKAVYAGPDTGVFPRFEETVLEENDDTIVGIDQNGITYKRLKRSSNMPEYTDYPIKDGKTLQRFMEERFSLDNMDDRYPEDWEARLELCSNPDRDFITYLDGGSLYGKIRRLAGVEKCSLLFYEEPELMDELFERMHLIAMDGLRRTLAVTKVDYLGFGDDIAYKTSTLISPAMFDKYILPRYKEACSYAMDKGVDIVWYDSDGYLYPLMESFLKAGITGFAPMEAAAGMDPVKFRQTYGRQVKMIGGLDKRAIAAGPESIRREVYGKIDVIRDGGYIPAIDHDVPPDISLADFSYLIDVLRAIYDTL